MLILGALCGFHIGLWDEKFSPMFIYIQWETTGRMSRQKYRRKRKIRKNRALGQARESEMDNTQ